MTPDASVADVGKNDATKRHSRPDQADFRHRVTPAGTAEVTISGYLGPPNADLIYEYLEEILSDGHPVTVRLKKAACDRSGVISLLRAANLAARIGCPFQVTGPATLLLLIAAIAGSGDIKTRVFRGSILRWPVPVDVPRIPQMRRGDDGAGTSLAAS